MQVCALGHLLLALQICCFCCSNPGRDVLLVLVSLASTSAGTEQRCTAASYIRVCKVQRPAAEVSYLTAAHAQGKDLSSSIFVLLAGAVAQGGAAISFVSCQLMMQVEGTALRHTQQT